VFTKILAKPFPFTFSADCVVEVISLQLFSIIKLSKSVSSVVNAVAYANDPCINEPINTY